MSMAAAVMDAAEMRCADVPAAPGVTPAATTPSTALSQRDIRSAKRRAKCKPDRAETCGKSQNDKMSPDRSHSDSFPWQDSLSFGPTRSGNAISASAFHHLRDCDAALHRRRDRSRPQQWLRLSISDLARPYGGNQINRRTKCRRSHHDSVRGRL